MSEPLKNPYVGPRFFEEDDKDFFFGRDKEARQLKSLVIAERFVLFYAQSGAGKSSLLNTRLIPGLREENFHVLPTARVGHALPEGVDAADVDNVFVYNLIISLDAGELNPSAHARTTLPGYLKAFRTEHKDVDEFGDEKARLLIVDQFEEIVTTHLDRWGDREPFFRQLTAAMIDDPLLWIVLTLREDYLAAVEAYSRMIPGGMRKRFYMERMKAAAALKAIEGPARQSGRPFTSAAAKQLTDNLRQLRISAGETEASGVLGEYVQPVQLQVVCYQLWENLNAQPDPASKITVEHLEKYGDVDVALSQFYEEAIAEVLAETDESELALRNWFEKELITEAGTRGTVYQGPEKTAGMNNEVVRLLANQYLLRAEARAGGLWFELVHDRFVEPILEANQVWRLEQNPLTQSAEAWARSGRDRDLLMVGDSLKSTLVLVDWDNLEPVVQEYLTESKEAQSLLELEETQRFAEEQAALARRNARTARQMLILAGALIIAIIIAVALAIEANSERIEAQEEEDRAVAEASRANAAERAALDEALRANRAQDEANEEANRANNAEATAVAEANRAIAAEREANSALEAGIALQSKQITADEAAQLAGVSTNILEENPQLALLLAIEAGNRAQTAKAALSLQDSELIAVRAPELAQTAEAAVDTALTEVNQALRQAIELAQVEAIAAYKGPVTQIAVSDSGANVAFGGTDDRLVLWSIAEGREIDSFALTEDLVDLRFLPGRDDELLALDDEGFVELWRLFSPRSSTISGFEETVSAMAVSPEGNYLAVAFRNGGLKVLALTFTEEEVRAPSPELAQIAFTPDDRWLAGRTNGRGITLWSRADLKTTVELSTTAVVLDMATSSDGSWLANTTTDGHVELWALGTITATETPSPTLLTLPGRVVARANTLAFDHDGRRLAASSSTGVTIWHTDRIDEQPMFIPIDAGSPAAGQIAFDPSGPRLATINDDYHVELWDSDTRALLNTFQGHTNDINDLVFATGGSRLVTGSDDGSLRIWLTDVKETRNSFDDLVGIPYNIDTSPDGSLWFIFAFDEESADSGRLSDLYLIDSNEFRNGAGGNEALVGPFAFTEFVSQSQFTPDGDYLIACTSINSPDEGGESRLTIYDVAKLRDGAGEAGALLNSYDLAGFCISPPQINGDGSILSVVIWTGFEGLPASDLRLFDVQAITRPGVPESEVEIPGSIGSNILIMDAYFAPDGRTLILNEFAFAAESFVQSLWDLQPIVDGSGPAVRIGQLDTIKSFIGLEDTFRIQTMLISPDGKYMVTFAGEEISEAETGQLWDLGKLLESPGTPGEPLAILLGHKDRITIAAFSTNNLLATADEGGSIHIWDLSNVAGHDGGELDSVVIHGHAGPVLDLQFVFDDTVLISGGVDGALRLWNLSLEEQLQEACRLATRNLTTLEYNTFLSANLDYPSTCPNLRPDDSTIDAYIRQGRIDEIQAVIEQANTMSGADTYDPEVLLVGRAATSAPILASSGEVEAALAALAYITDHEDGEILGQQAVFDIYSAVCAQIQEGIVVEDSIFACEQAVLLAGEMDNPDLIRSVCFYARGSDEAAMAVKPACESSPAAPGDQNFEFLLLICSLIDTPGYEEMGQEACGSIDSFANEINLGDTVSGEIIERGSVDYWSFTGEAGQIISARMNAIGTDLDPLLAILGPDGAKLAENDDGGGDLNSWIRSFTLTEGGTYYLLAMDYGSSTGEYELILESDGP